MFGRGVYGGFGRATRMIGRELAARNIEVTAIVPRRHGDTDREYSLNGIRVLTFAKHAVLSSADLYRLVDADIYHSQDPSLGTYLAMRAMPGRKHVVTFRDPMDVRDWRIEWKHAGPQRLAWLQYPLYIDNPLVGRSVRRADALFCAARFLIPKVSAKYRLRGPAPLLPTPVHIPDTVDKATRPTVCSIGRWHRRKRPELFFELAKRFPHVRFIAVGGTGDRQYEDELRRKYSGVPNLEMTGTIDPFETDRLQRILSSSWVLVNTAAREGLPITFLEAAANRCAILSAVDPDGFASSFGHCVADGDMQKGLAFLLQQDRWAGAGRRGFEYVGATFSSAIAVGAHLEAYRNVLEGQPFLGREASRTTMPLAT